MAGDQIARQAATYAARESKSATHLAREAAPAPQTARPTSQTERQAGTYVKQPMDGAEFKKFTQDVGLSDDQARKVVDWLLADEPKR